MPPTETHAGETRIGDTHRDPSALLVLAALLLLLRAGVTIWEHANPPEAAEVDHAFPGAGAPVLPGH